MIIQHFQLGAIDPFTHAVNVDLPARAQVLKVFLADRRWCVSVLMPRDKMFTYRDPMNTIVQRTFYIVPIGVAFGHGDRLEGKLRFISDATDIFNKRWYVFELSK